QAGLQRQLYGARDPADHGRRGAGLQGGAPAVRQPGAQASLTSRTDPAKSTLCRPFSTRAAFLQKNAKNLLTFPAASAIITDVAGQDHRTRHKSKTKYGGIAQLGERLNGIQEVSGSIPLISTKRPATQVAGLFCLSAFRKHHKNRVQKLSHLPTICIRPKMLQ